MQHTRVASVKRVGKADVYNLEVDDVHAFAVNGGIIVHNCIDATRHALHTNRKSFTAQPVGPDGQRSLSGIGGIMQELALRERFGM